ncbi:MAG: pyrimidine/purine nucleoside phosphorylase [Moraxella sp.]|nr:pyrimidine/purine nucleoside phosphorylase [Moraxella sp.]
MSLQLNQVSLSALATVSEDGRHLSRVVSFADGHQKVLGCLLPCINENHEYIFELGESAERIEITAGECAVRVLSGTDDESTEYYREGQSFVVSAGAKFYLTCNGVVQYIRHFEG